MIYTQTDLTTGRAIVSNEIAKFIADPAKLPANRTAYFWHGDLADCLRFCVKATQAGLYVKVVFPADSKFDLPIKLNWGVLCNKSHPNHEAIAKQPYYSDKTSGWTIVWYVADTLLGSSGLLDNWCNLATYACKGVPIAIDLSKLTSLSVLDVYEAIVAYLQSGFLVDLIRLLGIACQSIEFAIDYRCPQAIDCLERLSTGFSLIADADLLKDNLMANLLFKSTHQIEKPHPLYPLVNIIQFDGIYLPDRGLAIAAAVDLTECEIEDIGKAFEIATQYACEIASTWRDRSASHALDSFPAAHDRIAIKLIGLSDLLDREEVELVNFVEAVNLYLDGDTSNPTTELRIVAALDRSWARSTEHADQWASAHREPVRDYFHTVNVAIVHKRVELSNRAAMAIKKLAAKSGRPHAIGGKVKATIEGLTAFFESSLDFSN
jgi:hypothetical protein